jgi:membrane-associated phospholipid phosphatase
MIGLCLCFGASALAQSGAPDPAKFDRQPGIGSDLKTVIHNIGSDEVRIWTAPAHLKWRDAEWLAPLAGVTAGLIATDRDVANTVARHPNWQSRSVTLSNAGLGLAAGSAGGFYLWGRWTRDSHKRETGLLTGEAMVDAFTVFEPIKLAAGRERPFVNTEGDFLDRGSSFPSGHATMAFAAATVIAHEYPGPLTQVLAYGGASAIAISRVTGQQHFPSDVVVGSTLGYLIGRSVYLHHHDHDLSGAEWGTFERDGEGLSPAAHGSSYLPLDSWVYPVLDRLAALGYVQSGLTSMRPWTRAECARQVSEAVDLAGDDAPADVATSLSALQQEFEPELSGNIAAIASIDRLYLRAGEIAGRPLEDGFHFGQAIINDFGRPFGQGFNSIEGAEMHATAGRFVFYGRVEEQHAPQPRAYSDTQLVALGQADVLNFPFHRLTRSTDRADLVEGYVGMNLADWQLTFGKQSLWWGPSRGGPLLWSNNAEAIPMFRITRTSPFRMPQPLKWMGPVRTEFFIGTLAGHQFVFVDPTFFQPPLAKQPVVHGERISFKPTANLEFSVSNTAVFGGPGMPVTLHTFARTMFDSSSANPGEPGDVGDRRTGFDFSYRIPRFRKWLVVYNESIAEDWISPLANPRRSAMHSGLYMPQLPKLHRVDLRVESAYTNLPNVKVPIFYTNARYHSGYTNDGGLIGNWVGRDGIGIQAWTTAWLSPRDKVQLGFRNNAIDRHFLEGGRYMDFSARVTHSLGRGIEIDSTVQYERWKLPILASGTMDNAAAFVQLTYWPNWQLKKGGAEKP